MSTGSRPSIWWHANSRLSLLTLVALLGMNAASAMALQDNQQQSDGTVQKQAVGNQQANRRNRAANRAPTIYWPKGVAWDKSIPTPREFFGFEVGHRHLRHDQVVAYLQKIAAVSDRATIHQYGETHGGRPLLLMTITSPQNHSRIDEIRREHHRLSTGRSENVDLNQIPVVMNMGYGVHGDEPSATNTSPLVAHYLAAAQGDEVEQILQKSVILLDPSLNPDGFDRFARWANTFRGKVPNPDSTHLEHNQGWPAGRVNYYWFDLNRDWLPAQHPESQGRLNWYHQWKPNVVLDFHEMGTDSTFFFQPGIPERKNPLTPARNVELTAAMGKFHANALDQKGSLYFTQEVFDDFYMGKGSTYPDLHGSVGILFEQGSSRGHIQETVNGVIRFSDTIDNQFTASLSSLKGAAALRGELLEYQAEFYRESLRMAGQAKHKAYAFSLPGNRARVQAFASILLRHDIDCFWATTDVIAGDKVVKANSLVVPSEQPEFRFLKSLLERRKRFQESVFYDVSAWTLPLAFNLKQTNLSAMPEGSLEPARLGRRTGRLANHSRPADDSTVAWFMDWRDDHAVKVLQQLLDRDVHVRVAMVPVSARSGDETLHFKQGTLSIPVGVEQNRNRKRAIEQIVNRARRMGVRIEPVTSGLAESGIDLGSNRFPRVQPKSVAMLVGSGVSAYQAGAVWHQLDNRIGMPVSLIASDRLGRADLSRYTTLVLVSGSYDLSSGSLEKLQRFVSEGGTLIAIGRGTSFAQGSLLQLSNSAETGPDTGVADDESSADPEPPKFSEARKLAALRLVSGAIFETEVDVTHPLMFGFDSKRLPVFRGTTSLLQTANPEVSNPARYTDQPLMAGYASEENEKRIAGTSAITVHSMGRGRVILMIDDPNFRAFWPATSRVFMNAIYFGPLAGAR